MATNRRQQVAAEMLVRRLDVKIHNAREEQNKAIAVAFPIGCPVSVTLGGATIAARVTGYLLWCQGLTVVNVRTGNQRKIDHVAYAIRNQDLRRTDL